MTSASRKTSFALSAAVTISSRDDSWSPRITRNTGPAKRPSHGLSAINHSYNAVGAASCGRRGADARADAAGGHTNSSLMVASLARPNAFGTECSVKTDSIGGEGGTLFCVTANALIPKKL